MVVFTQIGSFQRPGNIDFDFLDQWEPAIALVAKTNPDNPLFQGKRGSVSYWKNWPQFASPTYRGGTSLYWNSPRLIVLPPEPIEEQKAWWSAKCTPNWQIFEWELEVYRVEGLPALPAGEVDLGPIQLKIEDLDLKAELTLDGIAQVAALLDFVRQSTQDLGTGQQQLAVAVNALQEQIASLQIEGGGGGNFLPPGV